jgi:hypothetical protein
MSYSELKNSDCKPELIEQNYDQDVEVVKNLPPVDYKPDQQDAVQIFPQEIKVHLSKCKFNLKLRIFVPL